MFKKILYAIGLAIFAIFIFLILKNANLNSFIDAVENRTFDLRQSIIIKEGGKKANNNIVIIAVDDATYEYILGKYGEWPLPRDVYANMINYLEKFSPRAIAFDMMFVKSLKSENNAENHLLNNKALPNFQDNTFSVQF